MSSFGQHLRQMREERGLSVNQLANISGVSASMISKIENGKRGTPKYDTVIKLANGLKVTPSHLLEIAGYASNINVHGKRVESYDIGLLPKGLDTDTVKGVFVFHLSYGRFGLEEDPIGEVYVPKEKVSDGDYFYTPVLDDAMFGDGIRSGAMVLVKRQDVIEDGEIGLVILKRIGEQPMLRRVFFRNGLITLVSSNPHFPPQVVSKQEILILGTPKQVIWDFK